MTRRDLLTSAGLLLLAQTERPEIQATTGAIRPAELGLTLMHEHMLVDFIGADKVSPDRYDADEAFKIALPHLTKAHELGCQAILDCTPAYLGRDVLLLARLSGASGVRILTNTGYYGAGGGKYLPAHVLNESAGELSRRWIAEWKFGIDGTKIKPAFIKIGVDGAPLGDINRKLVRAAGLTHRATGLPIHQHTGTGAAALEALDLLKEMEIPPEAFVWVHAQSEKDQTLHWKVARRGAWVEFDGIAPDTVEQHVELVRHLTGLGLLKRVLVSHDAGWYHVGEPGGGTFRGFETLFTQFLPEMRKVGLNPAGERGLLVDNPRIVLTPRATG